MAKQKQTENQIEQYEHSDKTRVNNPPVGLVTPKSDPDSGAKRSYKYDPHLDPQLQWADKTEHTSFTVPTVSLHVHERIDPKTIIDTVTKDIPEDYSQPSLFTERKPLREAIDFYQHKEGWSNRLIAGDSLLVMNSLLEKEGMAGKVQMVYLDPPYGIKYGSNFMPFINKKDVTDGKDEDLTAEPEMIKAFRDTWEIGIHSYLAYLRDRLLLARELLTESGSVFVQISDENVHFVRCIMDEIFGVKNFVVSIILKKTGSHSGDLVEPVNDFILWYVKDIKTTKIRKLFDKRNWDENNTDGFNHYENDNGEVIKTDSKFDIKRHQIVRADPILSSGHRETTSCKIQLGDNIYDSGFNYHWKVHPDDLINLWKKNRVIEKGKNIYYRRYFSDFPVKGRTNIWELGGASNMVYVVQTNIEAVKRCLLMTTDPGDLVFDPTCGSGTTAYVAEQWGRRWITCDTSRVALALAKQRLMTANFDYYTLAHPNEGVGSGFTYKTVPHITLKSIANNQPPATETLYDQPYSDAKKARITGPFTVESVPASRAKSFEELEQEASGSDNSISRSGETLRQSEWRDALLRSGVRAKGGKIIQFTRVEPLSGTKFIQAEAETKEELPKKVLVVFGPEHAPLGPRQVLNALREARILTPDILLFCAFQFDDEAAKDIDEISPEIADMQLLKAQMNADMLTEDLRKNRSSDESFWLVGQPDVQVHIRKDAMAQVEVHGFDYYNPTNGTVESGGKEQIAMWMLDTDYDNRSLFPSQVFFPMAGAKDGWSKLAKDLKAKIDQEKIAAFNGAISLPFKAGNRIAVKIIDDRGIESLRVMEVGG